VQQTRALERRRLGRAIAIARPASAAVASATAAKDSPVAGSIKSRVAPSDDGPNVPPSESATPPEAVRSRWRSDAWRCVVGRSA
jgi:hypothetical protein